ncbi:hypothetical protein [Tomitella biformata]|uniref:hypothetical protein n=1 Tax=Tomitella biformata TaxID=630403 RepID=UPI000571DBEE|nr:hypothetical protein [Tomitella biformata]
MGTRTRRRIAGIAALGSASNALGSASNAGALGSAMIPEGFVEGVIGDIVVNGPPTDIGGLINFGTNVLNGTGSLAPTQPCSATTISGGAGTTITNHDLGRAGPTRFYLRYETINVPDQIEVLYQGRIIANTGYVGDNLNQGTGGIWVDVPAGASSSVMVRVTGPQGTEWNYTVNCP